MSSPRGALFVQAVTNTEATYTVPAGKTLVITGVSVQVPAAPGTNSVLFNDVVVHSVTTITAAGVASGSAKLDPLFVKSGGTVKHETSGAGVTGSFYGYLVDEL